MTQHESSAGWGNSGTHRSWAVLLFPVPAAHAYSVLHPRSHHHSTWDSAIRPLLLKRFPAATPEELSSARIRLRGLHYFRIWAYYRSAASSSAI